MVRPGHAPVIELRRRFYADHARYHLIASSVTDLEWVNRVAAAGRPVLVVAEGLLMYLGEADVKRLFAPAAGSLSRLPADRRCVQPVDGALGHSPPIAKADWGQPRLGH